MPVFTKESHNHFDVDHFEVDNSFGFRITVDGDYFADDCRPVLQKGEYGVRRGADAFDLFLPRDYWRFVGAYRKADHAL